MKDRELISDWFHMYSNDVYNFLVYYRGAIDAEDLVQEVFIKASQGIASFRNEANPKTWLFTIARNVAIDHARKAARRITPIASELKDDYLPGSTDSPESIVLEDESMQEIYGIIMGLKENYREVLILRGIEAMNTKETAKILGWKESKVKVTYHRAKKALEKQLVQEGVL